MGPNRIFMLVLSAMGLAACATPGEPETIAVDVQLAPMAKPGSNVGDQWHAVEDGKPYVSEIVVLDGDYWILRDSEGCEWTTLAWGFAPSEKWSNCAPFADGTQQITAVEGQIWPLEVGKSVSYDLTGSDVSGEFWSWTRRCTVPETARITTVSGQFDTYKVVCEEPLTRYTSYVSPELGATVYLIRHRKRQNQTTVWQFAPPGTISPAS